MDGNIDRTSYTTYTVGDDGIPRYEELKLY